MRRERECHTEGERRKKRVREKEEERGSLNGPNNFRAYFKVHIPFLHCTSSTSPSNHFGTLFRSLWHSTRSQGTLIDLHGPPKGPQNWPLEANLRGPLVKQGPSGSLDGPNWSIFLYTPLDNGLTRIYSLVWGESDIRFQRYNRLKNCGAYLPPRPD